MKTLITLSVLALIIYGTWSACVVVDETQQAIVTRFGDPVRVIESAGLSFKFPAPIDRVNYIDKRLLVFDVPAYGEQSRELLTLDKKHIEVSAYTTWRVADPRRFFETVGGRERAEALLADVVHSQMGRVVGNHNLSAMLSIKPDEFKLDEIMNAVRTAVAGVAARECGVEIVDFRVKRINFPEQNRASVFERMRSERKRIATAIRSEGEAEAQKIRADADRQRQELISEAYRTAQETEGKAEAQASRIYADAFGKDPEFYEFIRTLESYEKTLVRGTTVMLTANSRYLRLLLRDWQKPATGDVPGTTAPAP